jgi:hypothetical protein
MLTGPIVWNSPLLPTDKSKISLVIHENDIAHSQKQNIDIVLQNSGIILLNSDIVLHL